MQVTQYGFASGGIGKSFHCFFSVYSCPYRVFALMGFLSLIHIYAVDGRSRKIRYKIIDLTAARYIILYPVSYTHLLAYSRLCGGGASFFL